MDHIRHHSIDKEMLVRKLGNLSKYNCSECILSSQCYFRFFCCCCCCCCRCCHCRCDKFRRFKARICTFMWSYLYIAIYKVQNEGNDLIFSFRIMYAAIGFLSKKDVLPEKLRLGSIPCPVNATTLQERLITSYLNILL